MLQAYSQNFTLSHQGGQSVDVSDAVLLLSSIDSNVVLHNMIASDQMYFTAQKGDYLNFFEATFLLLMIDWTGRKQFKL